jgi:drug/metabolite transporter (DMT)-like permease
VLTFFAGLERIGASHAAMISTLEPVVTVFLATFFLREKLSLQQLGGASLIIGGVVLLQVWERNWRRSH